MLENFLPGINPYINGTQARPFTSPCIIQHCLNRRGVTEINLIWPNIFSISNDRNEFPNGLIIEWLRINQQEIFFTKNILNIWIKENLIYIKSFSQKMPLNVASHARWVQLGIALIKSSCDIKSIPLSEVSLIVSPITKAWPFNWKKADSRSISFCLSGFLN